MANVPLITMNALRNTHNVYRLLCLSCLLTICYGSHYGCKFFDLLIIDGKKLPRATSSLVHARETITNVVKRMYKR